MWTIDRQTITLQVKKFCASVLHGRFKTFLQFQACTKILSDLSALDHVRDVSVHHVCVTNFCERVLEACWARQLKWISVRSFVVVVGVYRVYFNLHVFVVCVCVCVCVCVEYV
jgi:hypothetical protein